MARTARASIGGICYHVINRGNGGIAVFHDDGDYGAFVKAISQACDRLPMDVLAWCLMPNHIHLVLRPRNDGDLSRWMQWLLTAHVRRYHGYYGTRGHIWQGRFKAFPIQEDNHLLTVLQYVEANPLRAGLVDTAEQWAWSSLAGRKNGDGPEFLADSPVPLPRDWHRFVNKAQKAEKLEELRVCAARGRPHGDDNWARATATALGIEAALRPRGRPRKSKTEETTAEPQDS